MNTDRGGAEARTTKNSRTLNGTPRPMMELRQITPVNNAGQTWRWEMADS